MQNPLISSHVGLLQVSRPNLEHRRGAPEGMLAQAKLSEIVVVVAALLESERVQQIATAVTVAFVHLSLIVPFKCHHCHVHHYRYSYHYHGLGTTSTAAATQQEPINESQPMAMVTIGAVRPIAYIAYSLVPRQSRGTS